MGGQGSPPLIILHGILGSSRNWGLAGPQLAAHFEVHALDLPSHGSSPPLQEMTFESIARQVLEWMDASGIPKATVLGHSLGGKVAMVLASEHPDRVRRLIVADIVPRDYRLHSLAAIEAMLAIDLASLQSRRDAETLLEPTVPDLGLRKFLITNLVRDGDSQFRWQANLDALYNSLPALARNPMAGRPPHTGPTQFLLGEHSDFVRPGDEDRILQHFPQAALGTIPGAGHNLHFDNLPSFVQALTQPD